jgi:hypothetical protein
MVRWLRLAIAVYSLAAIAGCLQPSGTPRDPDSDDALRRDPAPAPKGPEPGPAQAEPGPSDQPDPGSNPDTAVWNLTLSLVATKPGETDLYKDTVRPLIERSCTAGGCHAVSSLIDLRVFPFPFEGSYTMDEVTARLGSGYDQLEAQKIVVEELISAVETDYMPPGGSDASLVTPEELVPIRAWLESGLKTATGEIAATLHLTGTDGAHQVCFHSRELKTEMETVIVGSRDCPGLKSLKWEIFGRNNAVLSSGSWTVSELKAMASARVEFSL